MVIIVASVATNENPLSPTSAIERVGAVPVQDALTVVLPHDDAPPGERLFRHWLEGRNPATIAGYRNDLTDFGMFMRRPDGSPLVQAVARRTPDESAHAAQVAVSAFLLFGNARGAGAANALVLSYRTHMVGARVAPRTINRRMSAIRSMLKVARMIGLVAWSIEVEGTSVVAIRDTLGPGKEVVHAMMAALVHGVKSGDRDSIRNLAILCLLYDLGLRREEVASLDIEHWEPKRRRLWVIGKKRAEREPMDDVPVATARVINEWIELRGPEPGPLFVSFSARYYGKRLSGWGIWNAIANVGAGLGLDARPHGIRHTAITEVLEKSHGDVRAAQRFSRHKSLAMLQVYDDNRQNLGAELAAQIAAERPGLDDEGGGSE